MSSANAVSDFEDYANGIISKLSKKCVQKIQEGKPHKAVGPAHEIKVYEDLLRVVKTEQHEQSAHIQYLHQTQTDGR